MAVYAYRTALLMILVVILTFPTAAAPLGTANSAGEADAATTAEHLTAELLGQAAGGGSAGTTAGARSLLDIAGERQAAMRILQATAPADFLRLALSPDAYETLPPEVQGMTEEFVTRTGSLEVTFQGELSTYTLEVAGVTYEIQFVILPDIPEGGSVVEVSGMLLGETITLYAPIPNAGFHVLVEAPSIPSLGDLKNLVVFMNFQDHPETHNVNPADFYDPIFADPPATSLNAIFQEFSYGNASLVGDVLIGPNAGYYTLPYDQQTPEEPCDGDDDADEKKVVREGVPFIDPDVLFADGSGEPSYDQIFFVIHREPGLCEGATDGGGVLGNFFIETDEGSYWIKAWIIKDEFNEFDDMAISGFFHEYIHTIGRAHANGWVCDTIAAQTASAACTEDYNDPFDNMGGQSSGAHPNAPHKEQLGWFEPGDVLDVDYNDEVLSIVVRPLEFTGGGTPKYIRLHRGDLQPVYYIEFRQPVLADANVDDIELAAAGVLIHWTHADAPIVGHCCPGDTQLVDTTPGSIGGLPIEDFHDAALLPGEAFVEETLGFTITTFSVESLGAHIFISPSTPVVQPAPAGLNAIPIGGDEVSIFWKPVPGVDGYTLFRAEGTGSPVQLTSTSVPRHTDRFVTGQYTYYVRSDDGGVPSALSPGASVDTSAAISDSDGDGFSTVTESYLGTVPNESCPPDPTFDAWPPDFNADQVVDATDRDVLVNLLPLTLELGDPGFNPRYDLLPDGKIDAGDNNLLTQFFGQTCVSNISGVYDVLVHDGTEATQFFYCKTRVDHDATGGGSGVQALKTASTCFTDVAGQGDPNSAIKEDHNIDLAGPPPPPPYGEAGPQAGTGSYCPVGSGGCLNILGGTMAEDSSFTVTCLRNTGGALGPNTLWATTIENLKVDVANQSGSVDIYYGQSIAECAARTPSGSPVITLPINQDRYDAPPYSNATSVDGDADGCADAFELELARSQTACGDDPWNPHDSDLLFTGIFTVSIEVLRADTCSGGEPAGPPPVGCTGQPDKQLAAGSYFHCQAALTHETGDNSITGKAWCYTDNPITTVNIENVSSMIDTFAGTPTPVTSVACNPIVAGGAPQDFCGDGLPGAAPPGPFADNDGLNAPGTVTGILDKAQNKLFLDMCFTGVENPTQGPTIFFRVEIDAHTGIGTVDIWLNQSDCTKPAGAPDTDDAPVSFGEQDDDYDVDQDGCTTTQELGSNPDTGGQRDPYNKYDHMDMNKDGAINIPNDILEVAALFGPQPTMPQGDVGPSMTGSVQWAHEEADGTINIPDDINGMAAQFGQNC